MRPEGSSRPDVPAVDTGRPGTDRGAAESRLVGRAARNNALWCDTVCTAHGAAGEFHDTVWLNRRGTPRLYPDMVTLQDAAVDQIDTVAALLDSPRPGGWAVKDSFGRLDLDALGFAALFDAEWIHLAGDCEAAPPDGGRFRWRAAKDAAGVADWENAWAGRPEAASVFAGRLSPDAGIRFLLAVEGDRPIGGGILYGGAGVVGLSNVFAEDGRLDGIWAGLVAEARAAFPGLPLVGYEHGDQLGAARRAGFASIGGLRVWYRS